MMLKHIVMWRFKEEAEGKTKQQNMEYIKSRLYSLKDDIPEIKRIEVGINIKQGGAAYDMALVSEFENLAALERYQTNPKHVEVSEYVSKVRTDRAVVDYEF
jgi:Stress responsive A/B Barrel Domain